MAQTYGERGGETITTTTLGNGTRKVSTVPGEGRVTSGIRPQTGADRSAAHHAAANGERFGAGNGLRKS